MSKIFKSSQVTIDSEKYILKKDLLNIKEKEEDKESDDTDKSFENNKEDLQKVKMDILEEAKKESDEIIDVAHNEKKEIISSAYDEAEKIKKEAREEGFEEGKKEGLNSIENLKKQTIDELSKKKENLLNDYKEFFQTREKKLIEIINKSVEKILNKSIEKDNELILNLVKKGIDKAILTPEIIIRVSLEDYENALNIKKDILVYSSQIEEVSFKKDESLSSGDCIIETKKGNVNLSIKKQMDKLENIYKELIGS
ncbi:MAG: FliH/SctL family protein [Bacillota bacterium]